jgi:hypothetical protein
MPNAYIGTALSDWISNFQFRRDRRRYRRASRSCAPGVVVAPHVARYMACSLVQKSRLSVVVMRVYYFASEKYGLDDLRRRRLKISRFDELNDPIRALAGGPSNEGASRRPGGVHQRDLGGRGQCRSTNAQCSRRERERKARSGVFWISPRNGRLRDKRSESEFLIRAASESEPPPSFSIRHSAFSIDRYHSSRTRPFSR